MRIPRSPFLLVNPKSYLYGEESLALSRAAEEAAIRFPELDVYFSAPFSDLRLISENNSHIIVTAQHMESLYPGRGMGHVLPESLKAAGAECVCLNHAENPMTVTGLYAAVRRAKELEMITMVCADSVVEGEAIAHFEPDILLCEPTDLIGTGQVADDSYALEAVRRVKAVSPKTMVMVASGVTTADDVYNILKIGADGTGATSGILKAPIPSVRVMEMAEAAVAGWRDRLAEGK